MDALRDRSLTYKTEEIQVPGLETGLKWEVESLLMHLEVVVEKWLSKYLLFERSWVQMSWAFLVKSSQY